MPGEWLSLSQVAEELGVHPSTVRSWADQGHLPVYRTHGGHRRFRRSEVELCIESQHASATAEVDGVIQDALKNTRMKIEEGHLEAETWYMKLDEDAKNQYRRSSRNLLQGLLTYKTSGEKDGDAEARAIGYEYASIGRKCGLNWVEATHAFLFFRNLLLESMLVVYETASVRSSHAWGDMLRKTNSYTDQILITLLETYDAYQRKISR